MKNSFYFKNHTPAGVFTFLVIVVFLSSCAEKKAKNNIFIDGSFYGGDGQTIVLSEMTTEKFVDVDSVVIKKDNFQLSANTSETSFFLLRFYDGLPITLVLAPGDSVKIVLDEHDRRLKYQITGNHHSILLKEYYNHAGTLRKQIDSLRQVLFESQALPHFYEIKTSIDATLDSLLKQHKGFTQNLVESNPSSLATILLLNKSFTGKLLFDIEQNLDLFRLTDTILMAKYPENSHVNLHHRRVAAAIAKKEQHLKAIALTNPGSAAPPIKLINSKGIETALNDLKGKMTILFFWASWSPESRADMQMLKTLYQQKQPSGFEVFAVSFDHREHFWKATLELENTPWINVNDPSGPGGSLAQLFSLSQKLPYYFVIDQEGIIQLRTDSFSEIQKYFKQD